MNQIELTKIQIDNVTDIMRQNLDKVLIRDVKLNDLNDKSENLMDNSMRFNQTARKLHRKFWWQNAKFTIGLVIVILVFILIIVLILHPWRN